MSRPRSDDRPGVTLAALVAVLHVSILAGRMSARLSGRSPLLRPAVMVWQAPAAGQGAGGEADRTPSKPVRSYCAGQLAVIVGMAVLTLVAWLHIMRIHGATGL